MQDRTLPDLGSRFIKDANKIGRNEGWRYFSGILFSLFLGQLIGSIPYVFFLFADLNGGMMSLDELEISGIDKNLNFVLLTFPFLSSFLLLWIYIKWGHQRSLKTLITPFRKIAIGKFFYAFAIWTIILAILEVAYYLTGPANYVFQPEWGRFIVLLLISFPLLLVQTGYEELIFRAYGMQWLGKYTPYRIVPLVVTSMCFGMMHIGNPEVKTMGNSVLIDYIAIGFGLGLVTLLSDSLEFAAGLHFANNLFASLFVTFDSSVIRTDALFHLKEMNFSWGTQISGITAIVVFLFLIKAKYPLKPLKMLWTKDRTFD